VASHTLILDGIWGRPGRWEGLRQQIEKAIGPASIHRYDATGLVDLEVLGEQLLKAIDAAGDQVNVVAHSMGGLVVRAAHLARPSLRFRRAVLMNSPLSGTWMAHALPLTAVKQMRPGSDFLKRLEAVEALWTSPTMVTWCEGDLMILPNRSMRWSKATCELRYAMPAHNWPRWSRAIQKDIVQFLA
jgi:triacylglycerol esterase/lipase EstA (alpha/beta hydrolase family)